jgi:hypothetical protein
MSQRVKVNQLVKPLADLERTAVNMIKTTPFVTEVHSTNRRSIPND